MTRYSKKATIKAEIKVATPYEYTRTQHTDKIEALYTLTPARRTCMEHCLWLELVFPP
jgi:hypothetical protein